MVFFFTYWMVKAPPGLRSLRTLFDRVAYACLRKQTNGRAHGDGEVSGPRGERDAPAKKVAARKP